MLKRRIPNYKLRGYEKNDVLQELQRKNILSGKDSDFKTLSIVIEKSVGIKMLGKIDFLKNYHDFYVSYK